MNNNKPGGFILISFSLYEWAFVKNDYKRVIRSYFTRPLPHVSCYYYYYDDDDDEEDKWKIVKSCNLFCHNLLMGFNNF